MMLLNNSHQEKVISAGFTGTTFMTLFSYLVSELKDQNFKEPELLGKLLYLMVPELNKKYSRIAGWNIHYGVGLIFAVFYARLWKKKKTGATIKSGLLLGGLSGLLAMTVWKYTFKLHPFPPKINFREYYMHLLLAHFIFGVFASIGYNLHRSGHR